MCSVSSELIIGFFCVYKLSYIFGKLLCYLIDN